MKKYTIGFIGFGNMAQAITSALVSDVSGALLKDAGIKMDVVVSDPDTAKLNMASERIVAVNDNCKLVSASDVIFIAVKPQVAREALKGLDFTNKLVVSIMASISLKLLAELTGGTANKLVRVMPNLNANVGAAFSTYCSRGLSIDEKLLVKALLSTFGEAQELDEELMNTSTGICGSGPAFVFKFINAFYDNGVKNGLSKSVAFKMALSTVIGSAYLVESKGEDVDIDHLVASVCSKGGTTIEGVNFLNANDFETVVETAIDKAIARAGEMSRDNENC